MALRIRFQYPTGSALGFSIERLSDGSFFDFADSTFKSSPAVLIAALPEDSGAFAGRYKVTLTSTPAAQFTDGQYAVTVHNQASSGLVVGELLAVLRGGDDAPVFPGASGGSDPWGTVLPGSYPPGTAGAIVGANLDAKVSSRSVYAGGPVASVTAPVTVGTNGDKSGYSLSSAGLDAIAVEAGVNARQALSPILASAAGVLLGAGSGTILIKGGNTSVTRITASTDNAGNRSAVTLTLPT